MKRFGRKHSLVTVLSLGFMVLGIGCIFWAMSIYSNSTSLGAEQNVLAEEKNTTMVESVSFHDLPTLNKPNYPVYPTEGDNIGSLTIPILGRTLPIYEGTGDKELEKGVGHFLQSVLPGEEDNSVLSGHRETVFRQLDNLKLGDQLIVQTSAGTFTYEVNGTRIVHEDDKTVIVPTDHAVLTLTTCYPFNTPGYFPDRYIVSADLVKSNKL